MTDLITRNGFTYYITIEGFFTDDKGTGRKPWRRRRQLNEFTGFYGLIQYRKDHPFGSYLYRLLKEDYTRSWPIQNWTYLAVRKSYHDGWKV